MDARIREAFSVGIKDEISDPEMGERLEKLVLFAFDTAYRHGFADGFEEGRLT